MSHFHKKDTLIFIAIDYENMREISDLCRETVTLYAKL